MSEAAVKRRRVDSVTDEAAATTTTATTEATSTAATTAADDVVTLYVHCSALQSRGDVVHGWLYTLRDVLHMAEWYDVQGRLRHDAPLELVYVRNSRKPYFLLEWRYPTAAELQRRRPTDNAAAAAQHGDGDGDKGDCHAADEPLCVLPAALRACAAALLARAADTHTPLVYKGAPVRVAAALAGVTVASERAKLQQRDAALRRANSSSNGSGARDGATSGDTSARAAPLPPARATVATLVPRAVRRRT